MVFARHLSVRLRRYRSSPWPRRLLALALLLAAGLTAAGSRRQVVASPPPVRTVGVAVAAHDLRPGTILRPADIRRVRLAPGTVPQGAVATGHSPTGRTVAAPMRAGEIFTDLRLAGPSLVAAIGGPGLVAVPIRLDDADIAGLLRPGDRVDVVADAGTAASPTAASGAPTLLAADVRVLAVPKPNPRSTLDGAVVLLAAPVDTARRVASAAGPTKLSITLRGSG